MWTLRFYNPDDDELEVELPLPALQTDDAKAVLGFAPKEFGSTLLERPALEALGAKCGVGVPAHKVGYLDFDAEPHPVTSPLVPQSAAIK
jgi:hypothetical protein